MSDIEAALYERLKRFPVPQRYCVAFSGGCDSHVLLHALVRIKNRLDCSSLHAIHVHHGLQSHADDWSHHCEQVCAVFGITHQTIEVEVQAQAGESTEALARAARYAAFEKLLNKNDMLLLAHHQDDQAETLLLQLLRGAGVKGLAAMPALTTFSRGWLARPLLDMNRDELVDYAEQQHLQWVDDPSNLDTRFDRNYLRQEIFPLLKKRWPSVSATISRVARHQAEAAELLRSMAQQDFATVATDKDNIVQLTALQSLSVARQVNVIRYWIEEVCQLPLPDTVRLDRILGEVMTAADDRMPVVHWSGAEVRRYRDRLFAFKPLPLHDAAWQVHWDLTGQQGHSLRLPSGVSLIIEQVQGYGIRKDALNGQVSVRFRQGGEKCRLPGRKHHHELRKLFQQWGVPPWQRDRVPLIFLGEQLAQIVGYSLCEPFVAGPGEIGVDFRIQD